MATIILLVIVVILLVVQLVFLVRIWNAWQFYRQVWKDLATYDRVIAQVMDRLRREQEKEDRESKTVWPRE